MSEGTKPLKMVTCPGCDAKTFIPGDLPPLATEPCKKCGHGIMMPMQLRQFELRAKIASGGMGTVYRAWDMTLERLVAVKLAEEATDDVTALMRARRGLRSTAKNNFEIVTQDRLMGIYNKLFGTFFVVGIALSSVGLLVGGVGVVAIMMISVTERTRAISRRARTWPCPCASTRRTPGSGCGSSRRRCRSSASGS